MKKPENQLQRAQLSTAHMYSIAKGIAGNALQNVTLLELDGEDGAQ